MGVREREREEKKNWESKRKLGREKALSLRETQKMVEGRVL